VEVPDLSSSSVWNLDNHVSIVDQVKISIVWKMRDNVEIFLNVKTKSFVKLSFCGLSLPFININEIPLLSEIVSISSVVDHDVSALHIGVEVLVLNFKDLTLLIDNVSTFSSPELPPS